MLLSPQLESRLEDVSSLGQVVKKFNGLLDSKSFLSSNQEKVTRSEPIDIPKPGDLPSLASLNEGK